MARTSFYTAVHTLHPQLNNTTLNCCLCKLSNHSIELNNLIKKLKLEKEKEKPKMQAHNKLVTTKNNTLLTWEKKNKQKGYLKIKPR